MKFLKELSKKELFWPLVVVVLIGLLAAKGLLGSGYFNMHDDLQMMRQLEMEKCFLTLQIPCRWVPDMGYGFGFPLFNFYPPLPYLFGEVFRIFGIAFVDTVKLTFIFAFIGSGVSMYFLAKEFFGKWAAVISSIFYIWAPYHAVDVYVRGAMNEAWALIFFPSILLMAYRLIQEKQKKTKYVIFLALSWTGLLLSHNLMALIFAPVFVGWCLLWILKDVRKIKVTKEQVVNVLHLAISGILAFGLVAFFTLPVTLEQNLVHTESLVQGYYEYNAHFATIRQLLISRFWGYGPSVWEANDGMSFQIGPIHWIAASIIAVIIIIMIVKQILKTKKQIKIENWMIIVLYFFVVGWFSVFMIHNKSTFVWTHIQTLRYVQFPWRFLTIAIFSFSFIAGAAMNILKNINTKTIISIILVGGVILYSWDFFNVQNNKLGALTDSQKFTGVAWDLQRNAGINDYLPKTAVTAPKLPMNNFVEVLSGSAKASNINLGTNNNTFDIDVMENAEIRLGVFQFPNWKVFVDGKEVSIFVPKLEEWGRLHVLISAGHHSVRVHLYDTPIRTIANLVSLVSWVGLGVYIVCRKRLL